MQKNIQKNVRVYAYVCTCVRVRVRVCVQVSFSGGSVVKDPPANAGDVVRSLGQKDPLETEMATHSSILAWEIPRTEKPGGLQSTG